MLENSREEQPLLGSHMSIAGGVHKAIELGAAVKLLEEWCKLTAENDCDHIDKAIRDSGIVKRCYDYLDKDK